MDFLHNIAKKINRLTENAKLKWLKNKIFAKSRNLSVAKHANLRIAKLTWKNAGSYTRSFTIFHFKPCNIYFYTVCESTQLLQFTMNTKNN